MIDHAKIEQAVRLFLEGIGEDVSREGLTDTPDRIARMCGELYGGMEEDAAVHLSKTFSVDSSEMGDRKRHNILFYMRASYPAILRESTYRLYSGRKSRGTEQACKDSGSICQKAAAPGAAYRPDRGRTDGIYAARRGRS